MAEMVQIRSVKHYFKEFIVDGLGKGAKPHIIKEQLLDAFRKEIFGQIVFKYGPEVASYSKDDLANLEGIENILHNSFRKWRRLCVLCIDAGLRNFIQLEDLKNVLEEDNKPDANLLQTEKENSEVTEAV